MSKIILSDHEDLEYNLSSIGLEDFILYISEENIFLYNNIGFFLPLSQDFLNSIIQEESIIIKDDDNNVLKLDKKQINILNEIFTNKYKEQR